MIFLSLISVAPIYNFSFLKVFYHEGEVEFDKVLSFESYAPTYYLSFRYRSKKKKLLNTKNEEFKVAECLVPMSLT